MEFQKDARYDGYCGVVVILDVFGSCKVVVLMKSSRQQQMRVAKEEELTSR